MSLGLALALIGLALIDSTSIGTLFIPIWLLLAPGRVRAGGIIAYLTTLYLFYVAIGIGLYYGIDALWAPVTEAFAEGGALDIVPVNIALLVVGLALVLISFRKSKPGGVPRLRQWRDRVAAQSGRPMSLIGLALASGTLELFTMLPYLAAIGIVVSAGLGDGPSLALIAAYGLVMVAPALVLLVLRLIAATRIAAMLAYVDAQIDRFGGEAGLWAVGIAGVLIAFQGGSRLFF